MELSLESRKFRRVKNPIGQIFIMLWAGFMLVSALRGFTNDFTELPLIYWGDSAVGVFGIFFMIFWFCFVLSFVLVGLHGLHTVHVSREGVRLRLWFLTIRELDVTEIKTVVRIADQHTSRLVLLTDTAEELREKSRSFSDKRKLRHSDLRMKDHTRVSDDLVKRYVARNLWKNRFWMEWSGDLEQELRKNLTTTIFIV